IDPSKVDTGWFTSNVDACRDVLPTIHPISSWANYLRHVGPHAVKPLARKRAFVAHTLDWDLPGRSLVPYRVDVLGGPERITEPLVTVRLFNRHDMRVFLDAPHAPDALVLQRLESAEAASKHPVDARPAKHNFLVQPVLEGLVNKHRCEAQLASAHVKLVRNLIDVRSRLWLYLETVVACFFHCVPPKSICTNRQIGSKTTSKFKVSGVPAGQTSTDRTRDFCGPTAIPLIQKFRPLNET